MAEKKKHRPWLAFLAAFSVILLAACGDTDPDLPEQEDLSGSALQVSVDASGRLLFQWEVDGADYYKLSVNPDGISEFVELVGRIILTDDVVGLFTFIALASPEIQLGVAEFLLESCLDNDPADPDDDDCAPLAVSVLPVPSGELLFQWEIQDGGVTHYRISIDPDGASGYSVLADFIPTDEPFFIYEVSTLNFSWDDARFLLESCVDAVCEILGEQVLKGASVFSVSIIEPPLSSLPSLFGASVALSEDGDTLAVGAPGESDFTCEEITGYTLEEFNMLEPGTFNIQCVYIIPDDPEGDPDDPDDDFVPPTSLPEVLAQAGVVFVYTRDVLGWSLHTRIEAPNRQEGDNFGWDIGLSQDGTTLVATAPGEDSASTGVGGEQDDTDNEATDSGAAYVFTLDGDDWELQEYVKASNTEDSDLFGWRVALSGDGDVLAVGAVLEEGADGDEANNDAERAGAVYTYTRAGDVWTPRDYLKAPDIDENDLFGISLALNFDGGYLAVGATEEGEPGSIDGRFRVCNPGTGAGEGAVYMFERVADSWGYSATVEAANADTADCFGTSVDLNDDATQLAVGAPLEDSRATGVNGAEGDNDETNSGAAYLFERAADVWSQTNYFKASNTGTPDQLGSSVRLSSGGGTLVAGAIAEASPAFGINGGQNFNTLPGSGAAYGYREDAGEWDQIAYIKPSIPQSLINFGWRADIAMDGQELAVAAPGWELVSGYQGVVYVY